jgi:hypothetical protein
MYTVSIMIRINAKSAGDEKLLTGSVGKYLSKSIDAKKAPGLVLIT